jgi:alpha-L-fucosidase
MATLDAISPPPLKADDRDAERPNGGDASSTVLPVKPTARQLRLLAWKQTMFIHYSIASFTGDDTSGAQDPQKFDPGNVSDPAQWVRTAKEGGFAVAVLLSKHEEGFAMWRTNTSSRNFSVTSSLHKRDIVKEFVDACRDQGVLPGLYFTVTDDYNRNVHKLGTEAFNAVQVEQIKELIEINGELAYWWFDHHAGSDLGGASGFSAWPEIDNTVMALSPGSVVLGLDTQQIGGESEFSPYPTWYACDTTNGSVHARCKAPAHGPPPSPTTSPGTPTGKYFKSAESDCSAFPGCHPWFKRPGYSGAPMSLDEAMQHWERTVGHGAELILNFPPDNSGMIDPQLVTLARGMGTEISKYRALALASASAVVHSGDAVVVGDGTAAQGLHLPPFDRVWISEALAERGQVVARYSLEIARDGGCQAWVPLNVTSETGLTIGSQHIDIPAEQPVTGARCVRVMMLGTEPSPTLSANLTLKLFYIGRVPRPPPPPPARPDKECIDGCSVGLAPCDAASMAQVWRYLPDQQATLVLRKGSNPDGSIGACLNVKDYGTLVGDRVWVTVCKPEHPDLANTGWSFSGGHLVNTRSKLCLGNAVLANCSSPSALKHLTVKSSSGAILVQQGDNCLSIEQTSASQALHAALRAKSDDSSLENDAGACAGKLLPNGICLPARWPPVTNVTWVAREPPYLRHGGADPDGAPADGPKHPAMAFTLLSYDNIGLIRHKPFRLQFVLEGGYQTKLYSFWVADSTCGESGGFVAGGGSTFNSSRDTVGSCPLKTDDLGDAAVPFPWSAVEVAEDGGSANMARRQLTFAAGPLPSSITADSQQLLSGPAAVATQGCTWTQATLLGAKPRIAMWNSRCITTAGSTAINATTAVHYDGWVTIELAVASTKSSSSVAVTLPMRDKLLYNHGMVGWSSDWNFRFDHRYSPELEWWSGAVPPGGLNLSFTPQLWLGDGAGRGVAFLADGPANWSLPVGQKERPAISVSETDGVTVLTVTMLESATDAEEDSVGDDDHDEGTTVLRFSLMPTPVRPLPTRADLQRPKISPAFGWILKDGRFNHALITPGALTDPGPLSALSGDVSLSVWVKIDRLGLRADEPLHIAGSTYFSVILLRGTAVNCTLLDTVGKSHSASATVTPAYTGRWFHLAVSHSQHEPISIYIDGVAVYRGGARFTFQSGAAPFTVGGSWHGAVADLRVLAVGLTPADAKVLHRSGTVSTRAAVSTVAHWSFTLSDITHNATYATSLWPTLTAKAGNLALVLNDEVHKVTNVSFSPGTVVAGPVGHGTRASWALQLEGRMIQATSNTRNVSMLEYVKHDLHFDFVILWEMWSDIWGFPGFTEAGGAPYRSALKRLLREAHAIDLKILPYIDVSIWDFLSQ